MAPSVTRWLQSPTELCTGYPFHRLVHIVVDISLGVLYGDWRLEEAGLGCITEMAK